MNKKSIAGIPPILENGIIITNIDIKANVLNDSLCNNVPKFQPAVQFRAFCLRAINL